MTTPPAEDEDPTGMRAVLRAAPDPGPMPAEVMTRILATLAEEQSRRVLRVSNADDPSSPPAAGRVLPLVATARANRSRWGVLSGAAAAVLLVVGLGLLVPNLLRSTDGASQATAGGSGAALAEDSAKTGPTVVVTASGTPFSVNELAEDARRLNADQAPARDLGTAVPSARDWGSDQTLTCLRALGVAVSAETTVHSDTGLYGERPAAILVVGVGDSAQRTAYLVRLPCRSGNTGLIASQAFTP